MLNLALDGSRIGIALLIILFLIICVLMVLVVLIQRPQGGGLSGAFGASSEGAGQTAFGAKVGDALTTATILIFVLFLVTAVGLNLLIEPPAAKATTIGPAGTATPETATDEGDAAAADDATLAGEADDDTTTAEPESDTETPESGAPLEESAGEPTPTPTTPPTP